ncbi:alpha/beta fold hydrolase [Nocardioides insulae]|uniref:alpha/beta fold hydrolase n=1 Tax=Nocardioides insulae TaxID=394734 RepID=UPI0004047ED5|nr:alpha/beta fold hydrolase [Nocardioides insulae]
MSTEALRPDHTLRVSTTDGLSLAAFLHGGPAAEDARPTVVLLHGYPDDHQVWDGVVSALAADHRVVTYDVRGAGASEAPRGRTGYRLTQLVADLEAVLDRVASEGAVHLVGHDWGSIAGWEAVAEPRVAERVSSFTSISGPGLDLAATWLRDVRGHPAASGLQLLESSYILAFQLPYLPELAIGRGVLDLLVGRSKSAGDDARPTDRPLRRQDAAQGLGLYRANFFGRALRPEPRKITVPCQVLAPDDDVHVSSRLQREAPAPYCAHLVTHEIPGNHWVVEQDPDLIADRFREFEEYVAGLGDRGPAR